MSLKIHLARTVSFTVLGLGLSACGSAYSGLTDAHGLGAADYQPSVVVEPGNEEVYQQALTVCRQVATNRQATAAQQAQLETLTGTVESVGEGAAQGAVIGSILDTGGWDTNLVEGSLVGAGAGLVGGLFSTFASGAEETADESRRVLLNCLRATSKDGQRWQVVE